MSLTSLLGSLALLSCLLLPSVGAAQEQPAKTSNDEASSQQRAQNMLRRAVAEYQKHGVQSFATFSRVGEFTEDSYYVYVLNLNGSMLASGGSSATLVGRNVSDMVDATGKPFFREMIAGARTAGKGQVEYHWLNRANNRVERKIAYFQRADDNIFAVGYYAPRSTPAHAQSLLEQASSAVAQDPGKAFADFNKVGDKFIQDDLYVFVVALADGRFLAHGDNHRLIGTDGLLLRNPEGKLIIKDMIAIVQAKGAGQYDYKWINPLSKKVESKHTFVRKVGDYLVGVGYYTS